MSKIGGFLRLSQTDKDLLVDDDEFIAGDESESEEQDKKWSCSGLPMEDEEEWSSGDETDESDYDSDALYDSD